MQSITSSKQQGGMGLIEIIITIVIVLIAAAGLGTLMVDSSGNAAEAKARAEATALAEQQMESLRDYTTSTEYADDILDPNDPVQVTGTNAVFSTTWDVTESTSPPYKDIDVQVAWTDKNGPQAVKLYSRIAQEEPIEAGKKLLVLANGPSYGGGEQPCEGDECEPEPCEGDECEPEPCEGDECEPEPCEGDQCEPEPCEGDECEPEPCEGDECDPEPPTTYELTINLSISGNKAGTFQNASISPSGACSGTTCQSGPIVTGQNWAGSITVSASKTVCSPNPQSFNLSQDDGDQTLNYKIVNRSNQC